MTSTEPMIYKPGPELNRRIAMKLFGFEAHPEYFAVRQPGMKLWREPIEYSTSWVGMKLVVEEMEKKRMHVALNNCAGDFLWSATVRDDRGYLLATHSEHELPHAVAVACLSALQHVSNTEEDKDA